MLASYLARIGVTVTGAPLRGAARPLEEVRLPMRVWPTDVDVYLHLNNGRYLTLMDMGRLDHGLRTGIALATVRRGWLPVAGAATVKFRRELRTFGRFDLTTRIAHWDDKWLYVEHRMVRGETVHAWGAVKVVFRKGKSGVRPSDVLASVGVAGPAPEVEGELAQWIALQRYAS